MENSAQEIKELYQKKVALFEDLQQCISRERDNLIHLDVDALWTILDEKQDILTRIEETRVQLRNRTGRSPLYQFVPKEERPGVMVLSKRLNNLKDEIKTMVSENVSFINETMDFIHELVSLVTHAGSMEDSYGPFKKRHKKVYNKVYYNEV